MILAQLTDGVAVSPVVEEIDQWAHDKFVLAEVGTGMLIGFFIVFGVILFVKGLVHASR